MSGGTMEASNGAVAETPLVEHKTLAEALLAAQIDMPAVDRDGTNPHFKSKFTTLANLLSKARPVLNRHGISVQQFPATDEHGKPALTTILRHASGESEEHTASLLLAKNDPQGLGSAITYMRRYALAAALAIADQEDDDANAATSNDGTNGRGSAQAVRREGQGNGQSSAATAPQRRKIHALASELGLTGTQLKAWIEWNAGTPHTDRIEKKQASTLIEMLEAYEDAPDALSAFNAALEGEDEKAQRIAGKYAAKGEEGE